MMKNMVLVVVTCLLLTATVEAASVLQVKGNSAVLELTDSEISELQPSAGQKIKISVNETLADGLIKKIVI